MANGNTTPIRFGSDSTLAGSATPYDLFLKIFSGEVLTAFEGTTVMNATMCNPVCARRAGGELSPESR